MGAPDGYSNINILGLALIITLSTAVIATNLALLPMLKCLHRHNDQNSPHIKSWTKDGILQVLRKAYEGSGVSGWSSTHSDVPIMHNNPLIPTLSTGTASLHTGAAVTEGEDTRQHENISGTNNLLQPASPKSLVPPSSLSRSAVARSAACSAARPIDNSPVPLQPQFAWSSPAH